MLHLSSERVAEIIMLVLWVETLLKGMTYGLWINMAADESHQHQAIAISISIAIANNNLA